MTVPSPTTREPSSDEAVRTPALAAAWNALIDDLRAEVDQGDMHVFRVVWEHIPTIEAEAEAAAAPQARVRALETALEQAHRDFVEAYSEIGKALYGLEGASKRVAKARGAALALAAEQPTPERDGGLDAVCPKCGSREQRTYWHERSIATRWHRKVCSDRDASTQIGEHLHHYCQTCHFDWCHPIAASPATPADPETGA